MSASKFLKKYSALKQKAPVLESIGAGLYAQA